MWIIMVCWTMRRPIDLVSHAKSLDWPSTWDSQVLNEVGRLNDIELTKKFGGSG